MQNRRPPVAFRFDVTADDLAIVRRIVQSTGFFNAAEVDVAVELTDDRVAKGAASEYSYIFAELDGNTVGYTCFGSIACTVGSFDLYWIAVDAEHQRLGLGGVLLAESERLIGERGGRHVYIETSNRPQYAPTRGFYLAHGYRQVALFPDFYAVGDDKVVYVKVLK